MMTKEMRVILLTVAIILLLGLAGYVRAVEPTVVDFDDLYYDTTLSGTTYAGLTWEWGNEGPSGNQGEWWIPTEEDYTYPYSEPYCTVNAWGSTLMGISFPETVNVLGAYFAGAGEHPSYWATGVRVRGYLGATEVAVTDWFNDIDATPDWFAMNLNNVDRIAIEAGPAVGDYAFYGMDDLTYTPEPATILLLGLGGLALLRKRCLKK